MNSGSLGIFLYLRKWILTLNKIPYQENTATEPCASAQGTQSLQRTKIKSYALSLVSCVFQLIPKSKRKAIGSMSFTDQTDCSQED